jgi:endonuclease/exonuclease/phosphatase family metal-dependent hydrolase
VSGQPSAFALTHLSLQRRTRADQIAQLVGDLPRDRPLVLLGDFNCEPRELEPLSPIVTFPGDVPATYPSVAPFRRLDHIGYSRHWRLAALRALRSLASDHLPLVADLALDGDPTPT